MDKQPTNYLTIENGVSVSQPTSQAPNCPCRNILVSDKRSIWLSESGLPQSLVVNMSNQIKRPRFYKCFGFYCWHDYPSNPSVIELLASTDGNNFITWTVIHAELRAGVQLFPIDPLATRYNFLKIVIKETFGASKTYLNQVFLFEENPLTEFQGSAEHSRQSSLADSNMKTYNDNIMNEYQQNTLKNRLEQKIPNVSQRKDHGFNRNVYQARDLRPRLNEGSISMVQGSLDDQTGNFFSPTQQNYFSNANLSLVNDTAQRGQLLSHSKYSPSGAHLHQTGAFNATLNDSNIKRDHTDPSANKNSTLQYSLQNTNLHPLEEFSSQRKTNDFMDKISSVQEDDNSTPRYMTNEEGNKNIPKRESFKDQKETAQIPHLTRAEKEVLKMKQEMGEWGTTMTVLQENMSKLLEKVSSISQNIEKENQITDQKVETEPVPKVESKTQRTEDVPAARGSHALNQSLTLGDYLEDFKKGIAVYLDNILVQNQTIISDNTRLKHNLENLFSGQPSLRKENQDPTYRSQGYMYNYQPTEWSAREKEIERIVTGLFERNLRSLENNLYDYVKSQNNLLEDKFTQQLTSAIEGLKDREDLLKKKVFEEIAKLQIQRELESRNKYTIPKSTNLPSAEDRSILPRRREDTRILDREIVSSQLETSLTQKGNTFIDDTQFDLGLDRRTKKPSQKAQPQHENATRGNIQKVQYLMEKLQQKIALRDKKVQELQNENSISLSPYKDNLGIYTTERKENRRFKL